MVFGNFFKKKEPERKERSDKKREVKPTISIKLKEEVERLSHILELPIKDLGVILCNEGLNNKEVVEVLAPCFVENIRLRVGNTIFFGHETHESLTHFDDEETDRVSIRFTQNKYTDIELLAECLGVTPSRATAVLIDSALRHVDITATLMREYNRRMVTDEETVKELDRFMKYINRDNPYGESSTKRELSALITPEPVNVSRLTKEVMDKARDTETYEWAFDDH